MQAVTIVDVSEWQGYQVGRRIDWSAVKASGRCAGALIRLGYGTGYTDHDAVYNITQARAAGLPIGTYLYALPAGDPVASANQHAAAYTNVANLAGGVHGNDLLCALDLEVTAGYTAAQLWAFVNQFFAALRAAIPAPRPALVVYSYLSFFETWLTPWQSPLARWIADYGQEPPPPWIGWQYTDAFHCPGIPTACDASHFDAAAIGLGSDPPSALIAAMTARLNALEAKLTAARQAIERALQALN